MSSQPELRLDWCSHDAAKYAVMHWHYSKTMPAGKLVTVGVWEAGSFIGAVIYGRGANRNAGQPFGIPCTQLAELVRVALSNHRAAVSRIVSVSVTLLRRQSPGLRLIFSYADPSQGHHGGIYQSMGWFYVGTSQPQADVSGIHKRSVSSTLGSLLGRGIKWTRTTPKHKYLLPLDAEMRANIAPLAKPYPKRVRSAEIGTEAPTSGGGEIPTRTLHL